MLGVTIISGDYVDVMCTDIDLYVFKKHFWPVNITNKLVRVHCLDMEGKTNLPSAVVRGTIGSFIFGILGTILGIATARTDFVGHYVIEFTNKAGFIEILEFKTSDQFLIKYLEGWL
jgi:hypothetical protein